MYTSRELERGKDLKTKGIKSKMDYEPSRPSNGLGRPINCLFC